jgi:hypothetical protein
MYDAITAGSSAINRCKSSKTHVDASYFGFTALEQKFQEQQLNSNAAAISAEGRTNGDATKQL